MFEIQFRTRFERSFKKLSKSQQRLIVNAVEELAENPTSHPHVRKIIGEKHGYRLRVGRWRVLYFLMTKEKIIDVIDLFFKKSNSDYRRYGK